MLPSCLYAQKVMLGTVPHNLWACIKLNILLIFHKGKVCIRFRININLNAYSPSLGKVSLYKRVLQKLKSRKAITRKL